MQRWGKSFTLTERAASSHPIRSAYEMGRPLPRASLIWTADAAHQTHGGEAVYCSGYGKRDGYITEHNSLNYSHFSGRRSGSRYLHPWCDIHSTCVSLHPRYVPLQHHVQIDETDSALAPRICFLQTPSRLCAANNYDIPPAPATPMTSCEQA